MVGLIRQSISHVCAQRYVWPAATRRLLTGMWRPSRRVLIALLLSLPLAHSALALQNSATGSLDGVSLDITNATVSLNLAGDAVTSAVAEIDPNNVAIGSTANAFAYDILPTIGGTNTGVDQVAITAPTAYSNFAVTAVSVGGAGQSLNCPTPGATQYCAVIVGQVMTITLGTKVTTSLTNIQVSFTADAPGVAGSADFTATVDDTSTGAIAAQAVVAGNADGDGADANSITVAVNSISGTVYSDEGTTNVGTGKTVRLIVNGVSQGTDVTDASGNYAIGYSASAGDALLVYIDGDATYDGTTVTVADGNVLTGLDIYADHVITRHDNVGSLTNANMNTAKGAYVDTEILYSVAAGVLTVTGANTELYVPATHSVTPGGNISTTHVKIVGTLAGGTDTYTVSGDWDSNSGFFAAGTSSVILDGTGNVDATGDVFYDLTVGAATETTTITSNVIVGNVLTIAAATGSLTDAAGGFNISVSGTGTPFVNNGAAVSVNRFIYSYTGNATVTVAGGTYNMTDKLWIAGGNTGAGTPYQLNGDLVVNGQLDINPTGSGVTSLNTTASNYNITADGLTASTSLFVCGWLFANGSTVDINGDVSLVDCVVDNVILGSSNWTVSGNWSSSLNSNFFAQSSTITFDGTSDQTITTAGNTFNNITLNNTGISGSDDVIISDTLDVNGTLNITDGDMDIGTNDAIVNTAGNVTIGVNGSVDITGRSADWTFDGITATTLTDNNITKQDLGAVIVNKTDAVAPAANNVLTLASDVSMSALTIDATAGQEDTLVTNGYDLNVGGDITIAGTLDAGTGAGGASTVTASGNWSNSGTFTAGTSTVVLNGTSQILSGDTVFNNLNKTVTTADTLTFTAGSTQTVNGTLTLDGDPGQLLGLRSSSAGTQWDIVVSASATKAIAYVDVMDSDASGSDASQTPINPTSSINSGNNILWFADTCPIVTNTNDSGLGSLRDCLNFANANPGTTISFNIPDTDLGFIDNAPAGPGGNDWWRITLATALPTITANNTTIDGGTQATNYGSDTNTLGPEIELRGNGGLSRGIEINAADDVTVQELVINSFGNYGINVLGATARTRIYGNYVGTDATGVADLGNIIYGIFLTDVDDADIGGPNVDEGNVISGNDIYAMLMSNVTNTRIRGNKIGTNAAGTAAIANQNGVFATTTSANLTFGGTNAADKNIISGNTNIGLQIGGTSSNVNILGNTIGSGTTGAESIGNGSHGIHVASAAAVPNVIVGGTAAGEANLVAHNSGHGINYTPANAGGSVEGNTVFDNSLNGINVDNANVTVAKNLIYSNGTGGAPDDNGIRITATATNAKIYQNTIDNNTDDGLSVEATGANVRNNIFTNHSGYAISCSAALTTLNNNGYFNNTTGLVEAACVLSPTNAVTSDPLYVNAGTGDYSLTQCSSPAAEAGVDLGADQPDMNGAAAGNFNGTVPDLGYFETNCTGSCPIVTSTADSGPGSLRTCINYANANPGTTISFNIPNTDPGFTDNAPAGPGGNDWWRITLASALPIISADNTTVDGSTQATFIGYDANPQGPEIELRGPAGGNGLSVSSNNSQIDMLVINNFSSGILITGTQNNIYRNYVGTDILGMNAVANTSTGITVSGNDNDIGDAGLGNLVSGNNAWGIQVNGVANNRIRGNTIGIKRDASDTLPNNVGLTLFGPTSLTVGGVLAGEGNIISGNTNYGVWSSPASNVTFYGNTIGAGPTGNEVNLGNANAGLNLGSGSNHIVGGVASGQGNLIAYNSEGINMALTGAGNQVIGNTIRNNRRQGIVSRTDNLLITNNLMHDNGSSGVYAGIQIGGPGAGQNNKVYQNTVDNSTSHGIAVITQTGTNIRNNLITNNADDGINCNVALSALDHNGYFGNTNDDVDAGCILTDGNAITSDPLYINAGAGNYSLTACTSPAVESGIDLAGDQPDMNGATAGLYNGNLPDRGALESICIGGNAVTSAVAEIDPTSVITGSVANAFAYDILPTIGGSDSGVDQVAISAPAGYSNLNVTAVSVGGVNQTLNCPTPGAAQYCAAIVGQVMTVTLGTKVTTSLTNIQVSFAADAPGVAGSADFTATVDDTATGAIAAQAVVAGNADGDGADANSITVTVQLPTVTNATNSTVTASPAVVSADGISTSTITVTLLDASNQPVVGKTVTLASSRGATDTITQPAAVSDANGVATGTISSNTVGLATITATDVTDTVMLTAQPQVAFNQGIVLQVDKSANKDSAVIGQVVTYQVEIRNQSALNVTPVQIDDAIPFPFKYLKGSARLDGAAMAEPSGNRTLSFAIGTVPGFVDGNGNGQADAGEPGYMKLSYQLVVGSGATPQDYVNTAVATDICASCAISNSATARVQVTLDPVFDLGTIVGKVFEDKNRDGWQDSGETGIAGAMVVLDNGTYALTDDHGRYHLPAITPGQRLVKINLQSMTAGTTATTREAQVVTVTPGLLVKANFGVLTQQDVVRIGGPARLGLSLVRDERQEPIEVVGSVESLALLVNGNAVTLPTSDIQMGVADLQESVEIKGGKLSKTVAFQVHVQQRKLVTNWTLNIMDAKGRPVRKLQGKGVPPKVIHWDGRTNKRHLVEGGEVYQYQMQVQYKDGSWSRSGRTLFGVNRTSAISLRLTGGAFVSGSEELSPSAKKLLKKTANTLRQFPKEKIVIEGHADAQGSKQRNTELSKKRAQAALDYLINVERIPSRRFVVRWYGEKRPLATNATAAGRELNRRVEVKGNVRNVERSKLYDQFRTKPQAKINQSALKVDAHGRFSTRLADEAQKQLQIEVVNARGQSLRTTVAMPKLEILDPPTEGALLPFGTTEDAFSVKPASEVRRGKKRTIASYRLLGRTEPGNTVEMDGRRLIVDADGNFTAELKLRLGTNSFGLAARNPTGYTRLSSLILNVTDEDKDGQRILASKPAPKLAVKLPPRGKALSSQLFTVSGSTAADNEVTVNGKAVTLQPDGQFAAAITLPKGRSHIIVQVKDEAGYVGTIKREVEVRDSRLFLLAFADGKFGQLKTTGNLQGAGSSKNKEYYNQGRAAFYLKGVIAGKYLITSAYDSGSQEVNQLFKDLDSTSNQRLLTNLDPDKFYPVYGDSSTVVYDAQSQGKFYLALDSDEIHVLVGNYALNLNDTELASYLRTLYGAKASYQSLSRSKYGQANTTVMMFGADVRQLPVTDELRTTGGSLYYLSHQDVIEGSEQLTLVVRDKDTGLVLSREPQQRNRDYSIKYEQGRVLFNRPLSSVATSTNLTNQALLAGNPVYLQVDYETRIDAFEKTASGGRVRQQLGDHIAVGGTYVKDELDSGPYELTGSDVELRLGKNSRVIAEVAESSGNGAGTFVSEDGGLTYTEVAPGAFAEGRAWKAAAELDIGEWFNKPDRVRVGGYVKRIEPGFYSNGNTSEQGTRKTGVNVELKAGDKDRLRARVDQEEFDTVGADGIKQLNTTTAQWIHEQGRWGLTTEYQQQESLDDNGNPIDQTSTGAAQLRVAVGKKLKLRFGHQQTLDGIDNNQSTIGADYQMLPSLLFGANTTWGTLGQSATLGASLKLGDSRVYLNKRVTEDNLGHSDATVFGTESTLGAHSKVYSEYQWENTPQEDRAISLIGAKRNWDLSRGFKLLLSGEYSEIDGSITDSSRYSVATGLSYANAAGLTLSTRNEIRRERGSPNRLQLLSSNKAETRLHPDFTLLGKYRFSQTTDLDLDTTEAEFEERSIGLAYRPVAHDRFNALARYTQLSDQGPLLLGETETSASSADVASIEWSFDINRHLEWVEKQAFKEYSEALGTNPAVTTHSYLSIHRLNYHITRRTDFGTEFRSLTQKEANDRRDGWLTEFTWEANKYIRFGAGYNFTDFSDNEFSDNDYSTGGWFMRLQGKF